MTRRRHAMPFGAEPLSESCIRFRLWAPACDQVRLLLPSGTADLELPMNAQADGWFELFTDRARPGDDYLFVIGANRAVPDPASRCQAAGVHGASRVMDPLGFEWHDDDWRGRPWAESTFYELHVGCFTPAGSFDALIGKLDYLADLGITAIQLMPVAQFPGSRNWGYDGVLPFAVARCYGGPDAFKRLVDAAHGRGLMVFLDVVYNHFGPEGNYLHGYAPDFFTACHPTPWGDAINFAHPWVRQFFIHNALYWLEEFHLDGLRLDAAHAIFDDQFPHFLDELADAVHRSCDGRQVHLVLENDGNQARYLERQADGTASRYAAQWNDDYHHALHVLLTGESSGYYQDFCVDPIGKLGRCLAEGFAYQGEPSPFRGGEPRGEASRGLPPSAFVNFLQNHDQIGNRAFGERIDRLADGAAIGAAAAMLLLAPSPPLLFMGQEWGSASPFQYFCDFEPELGALVREGRRREFASFPGFSDPTDRECLPDPTSALTFRSSKLDWPAADEPAGREWLEWQRQLLHLRRRHLVPRLAGMIAGNADYECLGTHTLRVCWQLDPKCRLVLLAHLADAPGPQIPAPKGRAIWVGPESWDLTERPLTPPPWSVAWFLDEAGGP